MLFPDELFYLKNKGEAEDRIRGRHVPAATRRTLKRTTSTLKATGEAATVGGLTLRLTHRVHGAEMTIRTDAAGEVNATTPGQPLNALRNENLLRQLDREDHGGGQPGPGHGGKLDLAGLTDLLVFLEYTFEYRN